MNMDLHLGCFASGRARRAKAIAILLAAVVSLHSTGFGWVYPEHRAIMAQSIHRLDARHRAQLELLWALARKGHESRLSTALVDSLPPGSTMKLDLAAWPAIAGDHSTSATEMIEEILYADWILGVASVADRLNTSLSLPGIGRHARTNALRNSDLAMLRIDAGYATRAGANNVHFLLARPTLDINVESYIDTCLSPGCELNAIGAYSLYHLSALRKASLLSQADLPDSVRARLSLAALADESFAIHFLEDVFASGHVAGTRGDASLRKGTHDYYNECGLEVRTWDGRSMIIKGDAWIRPQDVDWTSETVQASLEQLLRASEGKEPAASAWIHDQPRYAPDTTNVGALKTMPGDKYVEAARSLFERVVRMTPVPGLAEGEGELPRFRSEVGPFIGLVPALRGGGVFGGFGQFQTEGGQIGGLEIAIRVGIGLDGVMNESGDGLIFLDLGTRLDAASSMPIVEHQIFRQFGSIYAALPSRSAITTRIRMPFVLLPFDLLIAGPILALTSENTFTRMAAIAGNGGLIPWQAGIATSFGRFQFILGREVGVAFYGFSSPSRFLLPYGDPDPEKAGGILADLRTIQLEFPFIEYMPFRTFASDQSSSLVIQIFGSIDFPTKVSNTYPSIEPPLNLQNVWQIGMRAAFRWRHYW
jgi:hypothetical protein